MSKLPDLTVLEEIAIELGVDASFIEKDWYAVQALKIITSIEDDKFTPVFSGGTSLSKGYGLIERFSEDLDFKINVKADPTKPERRSYREKVIKAIKDSDTELEILDWKARNSSYFFRIDLAYPKQLNTPQAIRPHLQLEFTFGSSSVEPENREIRSFEAQFKNEEADCSILCVKPIETAADKLSALIWRVKNRERSGEHDDPSLIRHLHDIAKLKELAVIEPEQFNNIAWCSYEKDQVRSDADLHKSLKDAASELVTTLEEDKLYREEYRGFVTGLSYAGEDTQTSFDAAIEALKHIETILERPAKE